MSITMLNKKLVRFIAVFNWVQYIATAKVVKTYMNLVETFRWNVFTKECLS
jgi:hypothetical protein